MSDEAPKAGREHPSEILGDRLVERAGEAADAAPSPPTAEWLARHPDHASDLRAGLEVIGDLDRLLGGGSPDPEPESALSRLDPASVPASRPILLRPEAEAGPPLLSSRARVEGRYKIAGEIARGGMGVVLKGYDVDLAREVAVKVLREDHADRPDLVRRFVEEAQIEGQLQHPGIPPIYEIGVNAERRPYFSMKWVHGRTLSDLLHGRREEGQDSGALITVFASVCQTVAYAHARGVIHRDLKPSNVMVGSFGEVLVMDWGLGKVLARGGIEDERRARSQSTAAPVKTVRSAPGSGSESVLGTVIGTIPYISPEQARGEIATLDERADVFGLGAILCEILTGEPPYRGAAQEAFEKALRGDLADAYERLRASGADAPLVALATRCLAGAREDRPADAGAVARAVADHLAGVERRRRAAETDLARAEVRVAEERKRRRLSVLLSATVLGLVVSVGGGWIWWDAQRRGREEARERLVSEALGETALLRAQATDVAGWAKARASARRAEALARDEETAAATRERAVRVLAQVESEAALAEEALRQQADDQRLVERLDEIRQTASEHFNSLLWRRDVHEALSSRGLDPLTTDPRVFAARLRAPIRLPVLLALDRWREFDRAGGRPTAALDAVLDVCDPDPWRARLRAARTVEDLRALADAAVAPGADVAPESLVALSDRLAAADDHALAADVAKRAALLRPDDFWANYTASISVRRTVPRRHDDALRFAACAVSLRPESAAAHYALGNALLGRRELASAEAAYREALLRNPRLGVAHVALGRTLWMGGNLRGAEAAAREGLRLLETDGDAWCVLGLVLADSEDPAGAEAAFRKGLLHAPRSSDLHAELGALLIETGELAAAVSELREAIALDPSDAQSHTNLGNVLDEIGDFDGAVASYREAIRIDPGGAASAQHNLSITLRKKGDLAGCEEALREVVRLGGMAARLDLAVCLVEKGDLAGAEALLRAELRGDPSYGRARWALGDVLRRRGEFDAAVSLLGDLIHDLRTDPNAVSRGVTKTATARRSPDVVPIEGVFGTLFQVLAEMRDAPGGLALGREAVRVSPASATSWGILGSALLAVGDLTGALEAFRRGSELVPAPSPAASGLAWVEAQQRLDARLPDLLAGREKPRDADDAFAIGAWCHIRGHFVAAAAMYEAFLPQSSPAEAHSRLYGAACAAARAASEPGAGASESSRATWRGKALAWLRGALDHAERLPPARRWEVVRDLRGWQRDPDLAGIRDAEPLSHLPAPERESFAALWADVERVARERAAP